MTLRGVRRRQGEVSLQEPIGTDREGNRISLADVLGSDGEEVIEQVDYSLRLSQLRSRIDSLLTDRERAVVLLRYGLQGQPPMAQRDVAKRLGISRSYVSRIEKKALERLRAELGEM